MATATGSDAAQARDVAKDAGLGAPGTAAIAPIDASNARGDAGSQGDDSDAGRCSVVLASDYNQSCVADSDCTLVGEVPSCPAAACDGCRDDAINNGDFDYYKAAFAKAIASIPAGEFCGCPCEGIAICRVGTCQAGYCSPSPKDTLPACAKAGGRCYYKANTVCNGIGPADSCSFDDEVCCL